MHSINRALLAFAAAMLLGQVGGGAARAEIYRCEGADGVAYQGVPCSEGGEVIELRVDRPSPEEVARQQQRRAEMRALIQEVDAERRQREAKQAAVRKAAPPVSQPVQREEVMRMPPPDRDDNVGDDRGEACPLGLANCQKPDDRVFRRPAQRTGSAERGRQTLTAPN
ncbi:hypothetical protein [Motiliproteus sp. SC1-56]|uniref:hypothetical protein n=1 Tax=Motiliproteus sp. SC1-56 TaxID=2799565 RepID=UPI001A8FDFD4|nr:hypothetical protein [Motiliproteus sp. SC1-56]